MIFPYDRQSLSRSARIQRVLAAVMVVSALVYLDFSPLPAGGEPWCPLERWLGIPCLFCGITRALQALLHGDWRRALYFNWLAFPALALALGLTGLWSLEAFRGKQRVRLVCSRSQAIGLATLSLLFWALHLWDAVATPKPELLNPHSFFSIAWTPGLSVRP